MSIYIQVIAYRGIERIFLRDIFFFSVSIFFLIFAVKEMFIYTLAALSSKCQFVSHLPNFIFMNDVSARSGAHALVHASAASTRARATCDLTHRGENQTSHALHGGQSTLDETARRGSKKSPNHDDDLTTEY